MLYLIYYLLQNLNWLYHLINHGVSFDLFWKYAGDIHEQANTKIKTLSSIWSFTFIRISFILIVHFLEYVYSTNNFPFFNTIETLNVIMPCVLTIKIKKKGFLKKNFFHFVQTRPFSTNLKKNTFHSNKNESAMELLDYLSKNRVELEKVVGNLNLHSATKLDCDKDLVLSLINELKTCQRLVHGLFRKLNNNSFRQIKLVAPLKQTIWTFLFAYYKNIDLNYEEKILMVNKKRHQANCVLTEYRKLQLKLSKPNIKEITVTEAFKKLLPRRNKKLEPRKK